MAQNIDPKRTTPHKLSTPTTPLTAHDKGASHTTGSTRPAEVLVVLPNATTLSATIVDDIGPPPPSVMLNAFILEPNEAAHHVDARDKRWFQRSFYLDCCSNVNVISKNLVSKLQIKTTPLQQPRGIATHAGDTSASETIFLLLQNFAKEFFVFTFFVIDSPIDEFVLGTNMNSMGISPGFSPTRRGNDDSLNLLPFLEPTQIVKVYNESLAEQVLKKLQPLMEKNAAITGFAKHKHHTSKYKPGYTQVDLLGAKSRFWQVPPRYRQEFLKQAQGLIDAGILVRCPDENAAFQNHQRTSTCI